MRGGAIRSAGTLGALVADIASMGRAQADAHARIDGFTVVGLCARSIHARRDATSCFPDAAPSALRPDVVSINGARESLYMVLAADESIRSGNAVLLNSGETETP